MDNLKCKPQYMVVHIPYFSFFPQNICEKLIHFIHIFLFYGSYPHKFTILSINIIHIAEKSLFFCIPLLSFSFCSKLILIKTRMCILSPSVIVDNFTNHNCCFYTAFFPVFSKVMHISIETPRGVIHVRDSTKKLGRNYF